MTRADSDADVDDHLPVPNRQEGFRRKATPSTAALPLHVFEPLRASADRRLLAARIAEMFAVASRMPQQEDALSLNHGLSSTSADASSDSLAESVEQLARPMEPVGQRSQAVAETPLTEPRLRLYDKRVLVDALRKLPPDRERNNIRLFLSSLAATAPDRPVTKAPAAESIAMLQDQFPNFSDVVDYLTGRAALAHLTGCGALEFPPLLLDGSPGIGKTAFAMALATAMGTAFLQFPMSHATGSFSLGGMDPMYHGGGPGVLVREVSLGRSVDPLVLLDEVDKVATDHRNDPLGPLYSLWESHTASQFVDEGLKFPLNLSAVRWIATCNDSRGLHPALRSRCEVFRIPIPDAEQSRSIARNIYLDLIRGSPWGAYFAPTPSDALVDVVARSAPRQMRRHMISAFARAAKAGRRDLQPKDVPIGDAEKAKMGFL